LKCFRNVDGPPPPEADAAVLQAADVIVGEAELSKVTAPNTKAPAKLNRSVDNGSVCDCDVKVDDVSHRYGTLGTRGASWAWRDPSHLRTTVFVEHG
jgi:hypothetical protein